MMSEPPARSSAIAVERSLSVSGSVNVGIGMLVIAVLSKEGRTSMRCNRGLCEAGGIRADHGEGVRTGRVERDVGRVHAGTLATLAGSRSGRPAGKSDP